MLVLSLAVIFVGVYMNNILIVLKAEVTAPANAEEANRPDYVLNKYDYFGYGKIFLIMIFIVISNTFCNLLEKYIKLVHLPL
jgi:hypothetical protein